VIGLGYWGPNLLRVLADNQDADVRWICDLDTERLAKYKRRYPAVRVTTTFERVLSDPSVEAVIIATPVYTHYELAARVLEAGKHVFVEKPFTSRSTEAEELIELAAKKNLTIMVDHTFLFTGAVRKIRELIDNNTLGNLYYYDSMRVNLGLFQHDVSVIWDLAPHDLSIMDYLIKNSRRPSSLPARRT